MAQGSGKDGKDGPGGLGLEDFKLWKAFTHDVDPLEDVDWDAAEQIFQDLEMLNKPYRPATRKSTGFLPPLPQEKVPQQPPQLDTRTELRLRRGQMPIEGTLDLHGHTQEQAYRMLNDFILNAHERGKRCLLIITGKGTRTDSSGKTTIGVLKQRLPDWLSMPPLQDKILKVFPATQKDGGSGAWYVYLKRQR